MCICICVCDAISTNFIQFLSCLTLQICRMAAGLGLNGLKSLASAGLKGGKMK